MSGCLFKIEDVCVSLCTCLSLCVVGFVCLSLLYMCVRVSACICAYVYQCIVLLFCKTFEICQCTQESKMVVLEREHLCWCSILEVIDKFSVYFWWFDHKCVVFRAATIFMAKMVHNDLMIPFCHMCEVDTFLYSCTFQFCSYIIICI